MLTVGTELNYYDLCETYGFSIKRFENVLKITNTERNGKFNISSSYT